MYLFILVGISMFVWNIVVFSLLKHWRYHSIALSLNIMWQTVPIKSLLKPINSVNHVKHPQLHYSHEYV